MRQNARIMTTPIADTVWQNPAIARGYLDGVRAAIPGAREQIDLMLRLLATVPDGVRSFVDLGCGDGILGASILSVYPEARGVFMDFSPEMIEAARRNLGAYSKSEFYSKDYGERDWTSLVQSRAPFDAIVSGFSIHHQPDDRKFQIYEEIFGLLAPGGMFVNVEHVSASSELGAKLFGERFIDALYTLERDQGGGRPKEQIAHEFYNRVDSQANILAPVEIQCDWLRRIGFADVDCHFRLYELAVFAGRRP